MITKKMLTTFKVAFYIVFLSLAAASIFGDNLGGFDTAAQLFSIIGFAAPALYSSFNFINLNVNKIVLNLVNTDVNWSSGIKFETYFNDTITNESTLRDEIIKLIKEEYDISKIENKYITLQKKGGNQKKFRLKLNIDTDFDEEKFDVKLTHDTETTYRNSKKEINTIIGIFNVVRDKIFIENILYSATISFGNSNPFYKLTIKNLSEQDVRFSLNFKATEKTNISIYNNRMEINSKSEEDIRTILSEYITTIFSE